MSGKCPTVVQRPLHLHTGTGFDPLKQQFYVDIVTVDIVQPHYIRVILTGPLQKLAGRCPACKAVPVCQSGVYPVKSDIQIVTDTHCILLKRFRNEAISAIGNLCFVAFLFILLCNRRTNLTRGPGTAYGIDEIYSSSSNRAMETAQPL